MRKNGSHRLSIFLLVGMLCQTLVIAQWHVRPVPGNASFQDGRMFDDGFGVLISDSSGVFCTQNEWSTSNLVLAPNLGLNERFIPREVDTTDAGILVVVGHIVYQTDPIFLTKTYAMKSIDHGVTWEEFGERLPGRFLSVSFRGMKFGVIAHEYFAYVQNVYGLYAHTIRRYSSDFNTLRVDTLDPIEERYFTCFKGVDYRSTKITLIDSVTMLVSQIQLCSGRVSSDVLRDYDATLFLSTNGGSTFSVTDSSRNSFEAYSHSEPPKSQVIGNGKWTGVFGRTTFDAGQTWQWEMCKFEGIDSADSQYVASSQFVSSNVKTFAYWDARSLENPTRIAIRTAIADLDSCRVTWDQHDFVMKGDALSVHAGLMPYATNSKMVLSISSVVYIPRVETNHLLIYDRTGTVDVPENPNNDGAMFSAVYTPDRLRVRTTSTIGVPYTLRIVDLVGRMIHEERITGQEAVVNTEAPLVQGVYVVAAQDDRGHMESAVIKVWP